MSAPGRRGAVTRNVLLLGVTSLLADVSSDMVMPLLPAFLVALGGGPALLGLIEGAAEATAALFKYLSGRWSDRVRRLLPLTVAGYAVAAAVRPLLALAAAPWQVLALRCVDRVGKGVRSSPRDKLLAGSAPAERLAEAFAFHRGMDHLGAAVGPLLASALLLWRPGEVRLVFLLAAVPGALAVAALFLVREEPREVPAAGAAPGPAAAGLPPGLLAAIGLFTLGNSADALLLLRAQEWGVPLAQLPLLWVALHLVRSAASWPLGRAADRLGRQGALALGWCWYAACYAGFALGHGPLHAWALFLAYGLVAGLTEGSERALVAAAVPHERRGAALGLFNLVSGIGLLLASVLAGQLWERVSPQAALLAGAALALAGALVLLTAGAGPASARSPAGEPAPPGTRAG